MNALWFEEFGGPDVLRFGEQPDPPDRPGCAIVRMHAIGLNFADVYRRRGTYHLAGAPPYILGYEGAGIVERIGAPLAGEAIAETSSFAIGDRVAFADAPFANAEFVSVPLERLVPLPNGIEFETAAAVILQGLTAQYLTRDSHRLQSGEVALVHAAAGGVGLLLVQMAKRDRARVLGLTSSEAKREAALGAGADEVFLYKDDWLAQVLSVTGGRGVNVAFDSVGTTLGQSLAATRTGGQVVFFGMAGGDPERVDPRLLMDGSKSLTGGDLWNVLTTHRERLDRSRSLFDSVLDGSITVSVSRRFPLAKGGDAHAFLESRGSIGKVLLTV